MPAIITENLKTLQDFYDAIKLLEKAARTNLKIVKKQDIYKTSSKDIITDSLYWARETIFDQCEDGIEDEDFWT